MNNKYYPKVLIIGQTFNKYTGGGITMTNLFTGWPDDRIALASATNILADLDTSICSNLFQLGYNGKLHPFPLNIILPVITTGKLTCAANGKSERLLPVQEPGKYRRIYKVIINILHFLGLFNVFYKLKITPEFRDWINEFKPDIIYTQLSTLELIRFVDALHEEAHIPVAIHMMDDWPMTIDRPGIMHRYWKKVNDSEFRTLVKKSSVLMSICDAMSDEYEKRYGRKFVAFHNTIDIDKWIPVSKTDWSVKGPFRILYAGRLGVGVINSVIDIIDAVNDPQLEDCDLVFELQTADIGLLKGKAVLNERVKSVGTIDYADLPIRFAGADMLVLPHDFDYESINFLRYSFSTKITEYMISGTPVLVYADSSTSLTKYASKGEWAYIVDKRDKQSIIDAFRELYSNMSLREKFGCKAREIAIEREDSRIVREEFRKHLICEKVKKEI